MAKVSNIQKLVNQVDKNKGFKELISVILDNSLVVNNPNNIIEDNPGYLSNVLDILDDYEVDATDIERLAGGVVKALAKVKILHNNEVDFASLLDTFSKETGNDGSMSVAGDIFQLIKASMPDMTDTDAGNCAVYIAMSLALRAAFPEGNDVESEVNEKSSEEPKEDEIVEQKGSELGNMDLMKFLRPRKDEPVQVSASESTEESDDVKVIELGEEVIVGDGHKAHKVKRIQKAKSVQISASESTGEEKDKPVELPKVTVEQTVTKEDIRKELDEVLCEISEKFGSQSVNFVKSLVDINAVVDDLFEQTKTGELTEEIYNKIFVKYISNLSDMQKTQLSMLINQATRKPMITLEEKFDLMKGINADDEDINKWIEEDTKKFMIRCTNQEVFDVLKNDAHDCNDLVCAARKGNKDIFYHTLANICDGNQEKADAIIAAIKKERTVSAVDSLKCATLIACKQNKKLAVC